MAEIDPWYLANSVCPLSRQPLTQRGSFLVSPAGMHYPIVDGVPVMLHDHMEPTIGAEKRSLEIARTVAQGGACPDPLYSETRGSQQRSRSGPEGGGGGGSGLRPSSCRTCWGVIWDRVRAFEAQTTSISDSDVPFCDWRIRTAPRHRMQLGPLDDSRWTARSRGHRHRSTVGGGTRGPTGCQAAWGRGNVCGGRWAIFTICRRVDRLWLVV